MQIKLSELSNKSSKDFQAIWEKVKAVYKLTEIYTADSIIVATDDTDGIVIYNIRESVIMTKLFTFESLAAILHYNFDTDTKPYIGKRFNLDELKYITPKGYVVAIPLGSDSYTIKDITEDFSKAVDELRNNCNGTLYRTIVMNDGTVYDATEYMSDMGGYGLTQEYTSGNIYNPFRDAIKMMIYSLEYYVQKDFENCIMWIKSFIDEMFEHIYKYDSFKILNNCAEYSDDVKPYIEILKEINDGVEFDDSNIVWDKAKDWLMESVKWLVSSIKEIKTPSYLPPNIDWLDIEK